MFAIVVDQRVRFGQKKLLALGIECRGTRERERASIGRNGLSKNGLALITLFRRLPLANIKNQDACQLYLEGATVLATARTAPSLPAGIQFVRPACRSASSESPWLQRFARGRAGSNPRQVSRARWTSNSATGALTSGPTIDRLLILIV
jgi:hypothetical protein